MAEKTVVIGDRRYDFGMVSATKAVRLEVAIARVIGEPLFKAFMDSKANKLDKDQQMKAVGSAIGLLTTNMDPDDLLECMNTVFEVTSIDGKRFSNIDTDFANRNRDVWQVFFAGLKFNFSDFLPESLFASLRAEAAKALNQSTLQTSTGTSGGPAPVNPGSAA